ncbi:MAG TPA: hypothetical protein VLA71_04190 [Algoriphagus sp.]|nr:hypothetical protein [Algoriphagus sp.]
MRSILPIIFFLIGFFPSLSFAQNPAPIPLNKHYFEIDPEDSINHVFNKLVSYSKDSVKLERIFTLTNKVNRIIRTFPPKDDFKEKIIEQYDAYGNLEWKSTINQANSKYLTTYFFDGQQVGQVLHEGNNKYQIMRSGEQEPREVVLNDFEPNPRTPQKDWNQFLNKKIISSRTHFPKEHQTIYVAVYVNENGKATSVEWANPLDTDEIFANLFLEAVREWDHNFAPALDPFGNPVGKWRNFHLHLGGPSVINTVVFK